MTKSTSAETYRDDPVWRKIGAFNLDSTSPLPFSARLQREMHGWSKEFTQRAVQEYLRFFYLMCLADHPLTPSDAVDLVWHLHLLYTRSYDHLCRDAAGRFLHHNPSEGRTGQAEQFAAQYKKTLELYEQTFSERPPADIWPAPSTKHGSVPNCWVNTATHVVAPRVRVLLGLGIFAAALGLQLLLYLRGV